MGNTDSDVLSIISEPGALVFASRRCWQPLPENTVQKLKGFIVNSVFKGTASVFLLLSSPLLGTDFEFLLVRICPDEEGKQSIEYMDLTAAEAEHVKATDTIWG